MNLLTLFLSIGSTDLYSNIVGEFFSRKHHILKLLFDCRSSTKQMVSPLLLIHVNGASEHNVFPAVARHQAIATRWSSLLKVHTILSQARDI